MGAIVGRWLDALPILPDRDRPWQMYVYVTIGAPLKSTTWIGVIIRYIIGSGALLAVSVAQFRKRRLNSIGKPVASLKVAQF